LLRSDTRRGPSELSLSSFGTSSCPNSVWERRRSAKLWFAPAAVLPPRETEFRPDPAFPNGVWERGDERGDEAGGGTARIGRITRVNSASLARANRACCDPTRGGEPWNRRYFLVPKLRLGTARVCE